MALRQPLYYHGSSMRIDHAVKAHAPPQMTLYQEAIANLLLSVLYRWSRLPFQGDAGRPAIS